MDCFTVPCLVHKSKLDHPCIVICRGVHPPPLSSPLTGLRGITYGKIFGIKDAHRSVLEHSGRKSQHLYEPGFWLWVVTFEFLVNVRTALWNTPFSLSQLLSVRQHPSCSDCPEVKGEYCQNCSVLGCVTQCLQSAAHSYEQFLQVQQIRFVTLGPLRHA